MGALSHKLEDVLDHLRLGRMPLSAEVLDMLFLSIDAYHQLLGNEKTGLDKPLAAADDLLERLDNLGALLNPRNLRIWSTNSTPALLAVLTEYEEHRLRTNIEQGLSLYRLRVQFDLATIDKALET